MKERLGTAHRAGVRRVILLAGNALDLDDGGSDLQAGLEVVLVATIEEALAAALVPTRARP